MAKGLDSAVAPKERINIVYQPPTGGRKEQIELPLKVMVLGDFHGRKRFSSFGQECVRSKFAFGRQCDGINGCRNRILSP